MGGQEETDRGVAQANAAPVVVADVGAPSHAVGGAGTCIVQAYYPGMEKR